MKECEQLALFNLYFATFKETVLFFLTQETPEKIFANIHGVFRYLYLEIF